MPKQGSLLTATDELAQVLGEDLAKAFTDHRKALKKPMTGFAGQLMAKKLRTLSNPVAAVEQSILRGWCDVFEVKVDYATNGRRKTASEITGDNLRQEIEQLYRQDSQENRDLLGAPGLLATRRQTH